MKRAYVAHGGAEMNVDEKKLRELAEGATPGPWKQGMVSGRCRKPSHGKSHHPGPLGKDPCVYAYTISNADDYECRHVSIEPNITLIGSDESGPVLSESNAAFIAAVNPQTVIALLDEIERLRMLVDKYRCEHPDCPRCGDGRFGRASCRPFDELDQRLSTTRGALIEALQIAWRRGRGEFPPEDSDRLAELRKVGE